MARKLDWEKRRRFELPRETDWESRLERQANRILGVSVTPSPKQKGRQPPRVLRAKPKTAAPTRSDTCDIWRTVGADCPWNPTPGVRVVQHITSLAEARRLGLR